MAREYSNSKIFAKPQPVFSFDSLAENLDPNEALDYLLMYNSELGEMQKVLMNNINIGGSSSGTSIDLNQTSHGFAVGDVIYSNSGTFTKAIATSAAAAEVIGIVDSVVDTDNFSIITAGKIDGLAGLTAGTVYFLSPSSAGSVTATEPSTAGQISKPLLLAISTTSGIFANMRGKILI